MLRNPSILVETGCSHDWKGVKTRTCALLEFLTIFENALDALHREKQPQHRETQGKDDDGKTHDDDRDVDVDDQRHDNQRDPEHYDD